MKYLWIAFVVLLAVAAGATFIAFQNPNFVAGIVAIVASSIWAALVPVLLKRMSFENEQRLKDSVRRGQQWDNFKKRPKENR